MRKSDTLYVIKLTNADESFYKLGISYISLKTNTVRRFKDYEKLGYTVEVILIKTFASYEECFEKELRLKQFIKNNLYQPKLWANSTTTECFQKDLLDLVIENI